MKKKILIGSLALAFIATLSFTSPTSALGTTYGSYGNQSSYGGSSYNSYNYGAPSTVGMGIGTRGQNVVDLQIFLRDRGFLIMLPGVPYGYFGPATQNALYRYQQSNNGSYGNIYNGTAYPQNTQNYGGVCPIDFTLTTYNGVYGCFKFLNGSNNNYNTNYNYGNNTSYQNNYLNSNNATFENFDLSDGDDSDVEEGDNDAEIVAAEFDVQDGDARLDRVQVDFQFTGDSNAEDKPWYIFDQVRLLIDGDEIDTQNTDNKSEWTKESNDTYRLTFTGLDEILLENDTVDLTLEADIANNIGGARNSDITFDISIPDRGIRARDNDNAVIETGDDGDTAEVTVDNGNGNSNSNNNNRTDAINAIDDAKSAIRDARNEINNADDDGDDVNEARNILDDANDALDDANNAYDDQDYDEAVDRANDAENLANDAVDAIGN